jgi:hypothetical protein
VLDISHLEIKFNQRKEKHGLARVYDTETDLVEIQPDRALFVRAEHSFFLGDVRSQAGELCPVC